MNMNFDNGEGVKKRDDYERTREKNGGRIMVKGVKLVSMSFCLLGFKIVKMTCFYMICK